MKAGRERVEQQALVPPPATPPQPYEVRIRETVGNTATLIGHDGASRPFVEFRVPRKKISARMVERLSKWCRENDDGPELHLHR